MPEGAEVDTDHLRETIDEELEHGAGGRLVRAVALTTALFAAAAAITALEAGATVNEALALKTDATQLQSRASDQWAYYQAKGIKEAVARAAATTWQAAGKTPPADLIAQAERYHTEQAEIATKARELERERDAKGAEGAELLHHHHGLANGVALLQVAIALGAITALTRMRWIWFGSLALGAAGVALLLLNIPRTG